MSDRQKRVMICDDVPFTVQPLADLLESKGVSVTVTASPQDCLDLARKRQFDLFIVDMELGADTPKHLRDGLALAKAIWEQESPVDVPIVGITGVRPQWKERALNSGLVNFYIKPFEPLKIVPDLLKLLDSRTKARQAMESWLIKTAGEYWHVLDLFVSKPDFVRLQSTLVDGKGSLVLKGQDLHLAMRVLQRGMMDQQLFEELGRRLHEGLFPSQVNVGFHQHRLLSQLAQRPFRLLLHLEGSGWEHLPWEFCRYTGGRDSGHWLGGDPQLTCARTPYGGRMLPDEKLPSPLKILVVGGSHERTQGLDLRGEVRALETAFRPLHDRVVWKRLGPPESNPEGEASPEEVNHQLNRFQPDIVHFMTHGLPGTIILERSGQLAAWSEYFMQLDLVGKGVKLLVLNCCLSGSPGDDSQGLALAGLTAGVTAVVGHFFAVEDTAAKRFARLLYGGLVHGEALDVAFQKARSQVWSEELQKNRPFLPVLFVRDRFLTLSTTHSTS